MHIYFNTKTQTKGQTLTHIFIGIGIIQTKGDNREAAQIEKLKQELLL
jgi:hypothetical protein